MKNICPKESSLLDHVQKVDHYIIIVLNTAVVDRNRNLRNLTVLTVWLRILPLVIDPTNEERGNVVHPLLSFKFSTGISWTDFIISIMNTQAINIGRRQLIGRSRLFTIEAWQKDIMAHIHGHFNILCGGTLLLSLCMDYFSFASFLKIICLTFLQIWWKDVPLYFFVLCILHLQFYIGDDIGIVPVSIKISIIIIIIVIIIIVN